MVSISKRYLYGLAIALFLVAGAFALPVQAQAATISYSNAQLILKLQSLIAQLRELQRQLAELEGDSTTGTSVSRVDVEMFDDYAEVSIRYRDGDRDEMLFDADTESEVISFLVSETGDSRTHLTAVTYFSEGDEDDERDIDDIERIDVEIEDGDAHVDVRFEDGERDTFTIENETDEDAIIEEIADELDLDEDDVEDLIDFEDNDEDEEVDEIEVAVYENDNEAVAVVEYEDGSSDTFDFDTDEEDEIIEELAEELDMDEDDVEDVIDFEYEGSRDEEVDEIEVTIFEGDNEATAVVTYEDNDTSTYHLDSDDEENIIEDLANILDLDEDEIEDLIDFEYED